MLQKKNHLACNFSAIFLLSLSILFGPRAYARDYCTWGLTIGQMIDNCNGIWGSRTSSAAAGYSCGSASYGPGYNPVVGPSATQYCTVVEVLQYGQFVEVASAEGDFGDWAPDMCCTDVPPGPPGPPGIGCGGGAQTDGSGQSCGLSNSAGGGPTNGPSGPGQGAGSSAGGGGDGQCRGSCCGGVGSGGRSNVGDPCNISNGANWHSEQVVSLPGRTKETILQITRTYVANAAAPAGDFGPNWRHNWESGLFSPGDSSGNLIWVDDFGGPWTFTHQSDGSFQSPPGQFAKLSALSDHYELAFTNGVKYLFSNGTLTGAPPIGKLTQITDAHGEGVSLSYDSAGNLLSISNALSGTLSLSRDSSGHVTSITRSIDGLSYSFTYGSDGRLASETDIASRTTHYTYVTNQIGSYAQGMLASITDPVGRVNSFVYYDDGRVKEQHEPDGAMRSFVYSGNPSAPVTTVTDINGQVSTYKFNVLQNLVEADLPDGSARINTWNSQNLIGAKTDELGHTTQYGYDSHGNLTSITRADGSTTQIVFDRTWNKPVSLTPPVGAVSNWTLNPANGDVLSYSRKDLVGGQQLSLSYTRDQFGNVLSTNNGLATYSDQRDANGRLTYVFDLHNPQVLKYDALSRITERDYQSGRVLSYQYDPLDRLVRIDDTHGPSTINTFDAADRLTSQTITDGHTLQTTAYQYDLRDRITQITDASGAKTLLGYDVQAPGGGIAVLPGPIAITDPNGHVTHFSYDSRDRRISQTDARGGIIHYGYDAHGNLISLTTPNGNETLFSYDVNNRLTQETSPSLLPGSKPGKANATTDVIQYTYNSVDELVQKSEHANGGEQTAVVLQSFDAFDRLVDSKQEYLNSAGQPLLVDHSRFTYQPALDHVSLATANNQVENLSLSFEAAPPFAVTAFATQATDLKNRLGLIQGAYSISRDATGQISRIQDAFGKVLFTQTHDPAARLLSVASGSYMGKAMSFASVLSYDGFGRKTRVQNSVASHPESSGLFQYDILNRVASIQWDNSQRNQIREQLLYDPASNITTEMREFGTMSFGYDPTNEIVSSHASVSRSRELENLFDESFEYDLNGNRIDDSKSGQASFISDQILSDGKNLFQSDANGFGEITTIQSKEGPAKNFGYQPDGKLSSYSELAHDDADHDKSDHAILSMNYLHDALGREVAKQINHHSNGRSENAQTNSYVYLADQYRILLAKNGDGAQYLYLDGDGVNEHIGVVSQNGTRSYLTDHLGSVLNSDHAGLLHAYSAYGQTIGPKPHFDEGRDPVNYAFAGMRLDQSGMYITRHRAYDPNAGRWTTKDPIGFAGGSSNVYSYVSDNPVNRVDPTGLVCEYSQGSGGLSCWYGPVGPSQPYLTGTGYSGASPSINNPAGQRIPNGGVIPTGTYAVGAPDTMSNGVSGRPLYPNSSNVCPPDRDCNSFWIHGGQPGHDASTGCMIFNQDTRNQIPTGETLFVTQ